ncbi:MAG TPA: four helix bundle protein [Gemmatimonadales bacterium]|jgi:four helix bundle protein|nr:four helix bundle protein [Gemmatimonadales bacterium]
MAYYEKLIAWKECHALTLAVYRATEGFPKQELYGLTAQARRAAFSAAANIAEGAAKRGPVEFRRYLDIALGSLAEVSYAVRLAKDLGMLTEEAWASLNDQQNRAGFLTWRLYSAIRKRKPRNPDSLP